jgi:hypothetical protein
LPLLDCPASELLELRSEFCELLLEGYELEEDELDGDVLWLPDLLLELELGPELDLRSHFPYSLCDR